MERLVGELGYAQAASVCRWENGTLSIPYVVELALRWLIHVTPAKPPGAPVTAVRKFATTRRRWRPSEIAMIAAMDTTPPGAILEIALKLGRSQKAVVNMIVKLRKAGDMPRDGRWRLRPRGPRNKRIGGAAPPVAPKEAAASRVPSIMGDDFKRLATPRPEGWRSAIQGPAGQRVETANLRVRERGVGPGGSTQLP